MPKLPKIETSEESELKPHMYDCIVFYPTPNQMHFDYFTFTGKRVVHSEDERIPCHVSLYSFKNNKIELFESFRAHFSDPKEYTRMLQTQTRMFGVIMRDVKKAKPLLNTFKKDGIELLSALIEVKLEEERKQLPLWTRFRMWYSGKSIHHEEGEHDAE